MEPEEPSDPKDPKDPPKKPEDPKDPKDPPKKPEDPEKDKKKECASLAQDIANLRINIGEINERINKISAKIESTREKIAAIEAEAKSHAENTALIGAGKGALQGALAGAKNVPIPGLPKIGGAIVGGLISGLRGAGTQLGTDIKRGEFSQKLEEQNKILIALFQQLKLQNDDLQEKDTKLSESIAKSEALGCNAKN